MPWTDNQKETAIKFFMIHIQLKKPPRKQEVIALIEKHPGVFDNKSWEKIKIFIINIYKSKGADYINDLINK